MYLRSNYSNDSSIEESRVETTRDFCSLTNKSAILYGDQESPNIIIINLQDVSTSKNWPLALPKLYTPLNTFSSYIVHCIFLFAFSSLFLLINCPVIFVFSGLLLLINCQFFLFYGVYFSFKIAQFSLFFFFFQFISFHRISNSFSVFSNLIFVINYSFISVFSSLILINCPLFSVFSC